MLELLYCMLVGAGAFFLLVSIFYGLSMLFHKRESTEEISPEEERYLQHIAEMALYLNEIRCALNALASVHGDKSKLLNSDDEDPTDEEASS